MLRQRDLAKLSALQLVPLYGMCYYGPELSVLYCLSCISMGTGTPSNCLKGNDLEHRKPCATRPDLNGNTKSQSGMSDGWKVGCTHLRYPWTRHQPRLTDCFTGSAPRRPPRSRHIGIVTRLQYRVFAATIGGNRLQVLR